MLKLLMGSLLLSLELIAFLSALVLAKVVPSAEQVLALVICQSITALRLPEIQVIFNSGRATTILEGLLGNILIEVLIVTIISSSQIKMLQFIILFVVRAGSSNGQLWVILIQISI
jgi:hypothetical protein